MSLYTIISTGTTVIPVAVRALALSVWKEIGTVSSVEVKYPIQWWPAVQFRFLLTNVTEIYYISD